MNLKAHVRLLVVLAVVAMAGAASAQTFTLNIFHNNDGESALLPAGDEGGIARYITKIDAERAAVPMGEGVLTLSSGDNFLASPEFNYSLEQGPPYYDTMALEMIGYDALCIGNHDFDFGPDVLAGFIDGFTGPVQYLSANLDFSGEPGLDALVTAGTIAASTVVTTEGEQIGIVGATTEALPFISSPRDVVVNAVAPAVQAEIDALTLMGVDKIILISHLQSILEDQALAPLLTGVDVMIAGGGDELLASAGDALQPSDTLGDVYGDYPLYAVGGDGASIPVVTTSGQYRYVGQLVVEFDAMGEVIGVDDARSRPHRVIGGLEPDAVLPDPTAQTTIEDPLDAALAGLASEILATSEVALDGVRSHVRTMETNQGNLIADALLWTATQRAADYGLPVPDVALQNGGGIRNDSEYPAGPISTLNTFEMVPFANFVSIVPNVSRERFQWILENAVSRVEFTDGRFAQVSDGCVFTYNPSGQPQLLDDDGNVTQQGRRVVDVWVNGQQIVALGEVVPGPDLTVATINFLAGGGDQYPFGGLPFTQVGATYQQALQGYLTVALGGVIALGDYPEGGEGRISTSDVVAIDDRADDLPDAGDAAAFAVRQNFPNPFNPSTTIAFDLPRAERVRVAIYDVAGRLVRELMDGKGVEGTNVLQWAGTNARGDRVPSGVYLYRVETAQRIETRSMTLVK